MTPTTRPATRSRAQNISPEHELRITVIFSLRVDGVRGIVKLLKVLDPRYVYIFHSSLLQFTLISFTHSQLHPSPLASSTSPAHLATQTTAGDASKPPPNCHGGQSCPVRTCCPSICVIPLFKVLCSFNKEYAGFLANSPTGEFINVVIARTDKRTRAFEGTLVGALRNISGWLVQAAPLSASASSESDSSSGSGIHPSIPRLFAVSHLPSVMSAFLSHTLGAERD